MNIKSSNNATILSEVSAAEKKAAQTPAAENAPDYKLNRFDRFDRYNGVSADDGALPLNGEIQRKRGIFSENTSAEVGEKILRAQERFDGCAPEGFSAKHIISAFFQAESEDRYNVCVNYEAGAEKGRSCQDCIREQVDIGLFNEDSVALIASQVGKYVDSLYDQGKFTDDEYAQLNKEIKECSKHWLKRIIDSRVGNRLREIDKKKGGGLVYVKKPVKTREERLLEELSMRRRIEAENPFDITAFFAKIDQMRFNVTGLKEDSNKASDKTAPATDNT